MGKKELKGLNFVGKPKLPSPGKARATRSGEAFKDRVRMAAYAKGRLFKPMRPYYRHDGKNPTVQRELIGGRPCDVITTKSGQKCYRIPGTTHCSWSKEEARIFGEMSYDGALDGGMAFLNANYTTELRLNEILAGHNVTLGEFLVMTFSYILKSFRI